MNTSVERKSCEKVFQIGRYKVDGFLDRIEDMIKAGKINCDVGISMAQELCDIDFPSSELDEIILSWIDTMEARYSKQENTYMVHSIKAVHC